LAEELVNAPASERDAVLAKLQDGRGVEFTEALAAAIGRLDEDVRRQARDTLTRRLARMKPDTLGRYLKDEEPEIRRAAAVACAMRELKVHIPLLIPLLGDANRDVAMAARAALKELSGEDLGTDVDAWQKWWDKHSKD
jgi:HEAT repeat protein